MVDKLGEAQRKDLQRTGEAGAWGSPTELENQRRIKLAVAAYAYEVMNISLMSDQEFDDECKLIDLTKDTAYPIWDAWWRSNFSPHTGMWIHKHPNPEGLQRLINIKLLYQEKG